MRINTSADNRERTKMQRKYVYPKILVWGIYDVPVGNGAAVGRAD